jgi:hypothetical protein
MKIMKNQRESMLWRARGHGPVAPPLTPDNSAARRTAGVASISTGQLSRIVCHVALIVTLRRVRRVALSRMTLARSADWAIAAGLSRVVTILSILPDSCSRRIRRS